MQKNNEAKQNKLDKDLKDSFPASDPLSSNMGSQKTYDEREKKNAEPKKPQTVDK